MDLIPAGMWLRVSSGGQDEENQAPDIRRYAADHDYQIDRTYTVHGKSAYHGEHEAELAKALADMRAGVIRVLIVWASDRIERRGAESVFDLARRVREANGRIEYVKDAYLNDVNDMSPVMLALAATRDHQESKRKSQRTRMVQATISGNGALHGRPPWGYVTAGELKYNHTIVPTEVARTYAPQIFARCIAGDSLATIALWLDSEGVPAVRGGNWSPKSVSQIIRNPTYTGRRQDADGRTVLRCEPVVDAKTFAAAGRALGDRPKRGPLTGHTALLTGVVFCAKCHAPMYRIHAGKGNNHYYYRCAGKGAVRRSECRNMIRLDALDQMIHSLMMACREPVTERRLIPGDNHDAELEGVRMDLRELPSRDLPDAEHDAELARLRAERDRLAALPSVPDRSVLVETGETVAFKWAASDHNGRRAMLLGKVRVLADSDTFPLLAFESDYKLNVPVDTAADTA